MSLDTRLQPPTNMIFCICRRAKSSACTFYKVTGSYTENSGFIEKYVTVRGTTSSFFEKKFLKPSTYCHLLWLSWPTLGCLPVGTRIYTVQMPQRSDCTNQTTQSVIMAMASPETCSLVLSKQLAIQVGVGWLRLNHTDLLYIASIKYA